MKKLLTFLQGKKNIIAGIITTTSAYLVEMGQIDTKTGVFIASITLLVFGSASIATGKMLKK